VSSYILDATKASVLAVSKDVIGSEPIRTNALDAISIDEFAAVLVI
jgi:hypothetical protein